MSDTAAPEGDAILTDGANGSIVFGSGEESVVIESVLDPELDLGDELPRSLSGVLAGPTLVAQFDQLSAVVVPIDLEAEAPAGSLFALAASGLQEGVDLEFCESEGGLLAVTGNLAPLGETTANESFALTVGPGSGNSTSELDGNKAIVRGTLGARTFGQVEYLLAANPQVDTLVLQEVDCSENDEVNVETARLVRDAGLTTLVPADGEIYSGGVDMFAALGRRIAEDGATLGIHARCCGPNGESAHELDQHDAANDSHLAYSNEILGTDFGLGFYFHTPQAAPFDGIETMSRAEIEAFDFVTEDIVLADAVATDLAPMAAGYTVGTLVQLAERMAGEISDSGPATAEVLVVLAGEPATAVIGVTGLDNDTNEGEILTVTLEPDDSAGWGLVDATSRSICRSKVRARACS